VPRRLLPPLVLAGLGLLFFADLVVQPTQVLYSDYSDILAQHIPAKHFLVRSWGATGELPLWCPYRFGGEPFVHDVQVGLFYPPHAIFYVLPENGVGVALSWLIVAHVILAGLGLYAYARDQGLGTAGALVAACGFMFAGKWLLHLLGGGHYVTVGLAWLPLVLLFLERAVRHGSLRCATAAGLFFGLLALGTQPQWTFYAGLFLALWTLGTALECAGVWDGVLTTEAGSPPLWCVLRTACSVLGTPYFRRWLGWGAWTALLGGALAAVQFLPTLEAAAQSTRSAGVDAGDLLRGGLRSLVFIGGPALSSEPACLMWEDRGGFGLLWLAVAALAPVLCRGRVRYQAGVTGVLFVFAFGGSALFQGLPGFSLFRQHARMLLIAALPVAYLAGVATHALATAPELSAVVRSRCRHVAGRVLAAVALLVGVFAFRLWLSHQPVRFHVYWLLLLLTVPAAFWLLSQAGTMARPRWSLAWGVVLVADLWALAWPLVAVRPEVDVYGRSPCADYLAEHAGEHGRVLDLDAPEPTALPAFGASTVGLLGSSSGQGPLLAASAVFPGRTDVFQTSTPLGTGGPLAMMNGLESLRGYNPLDNLRYKEYLQFITGEDRPLRPLDGGLTFPVISNFYIKNRSLLDLLGTRYLVAPLDDAREKDGWQRRYDDEHPVCYDFIAGGLRELPHYAVYENSRVLPRAFVVPHAAPLPARPEVLAALTSTDFRDTVLLEGYEPAAEDPSAGTVRSAVIADYRPNRVTVRVNGNAPGYLVLTDVWYPGWVCTVDGAPVGLHRADFLFRAVRVPAGEHEVVFTFAPRSYQLGRQVSVFALAAAAAALLLSWLVSRLRRSIPGPLPGGK
jgi:hypothetical protein